MTHFAFLKRKNALTTLKAIMDRIFAPHMWAGFVYKKESGKSQKFCDLALCRCILSKWSINFSKTFVQHYIFVLKTRIPCGKLQKNKNADRGGQNK